MAAGNTTTAVLGAAGPAYHAGGGTTLLSANLDLISEP